MKTYLTMLDHVLTHGTRRTDRTGVGTIGVFGYQNRYDLAAGFPLLTTKKIHTRSVVAELLWFLRGDTNVAYLHEHGCRIWDEWAGPDGELGPVYGRQWRAWERPDGLAVDQIATVVRDLRLNPYSRRHIVSAWNPADVPAQALPACHALFQFYVTPPDPEIPGARGKLSCQLYQRSADIFLGVPFNVASYALLTHILATSAGLEVGELVHTFGDLHLYANHVDQARLQLSREPRETPQLRIEPRTAGVDATELTDPGLDLHYRLWLENGQAVTAAGNKGRFQLLPEVDVLPAYQVSDFTFEGYDPHPGIKAPVAV